MRLLRELVLSEKTSPLIYVESAIDILAWLSFVMDSSIKVVVSLAGLQPTTLAFKDCLDSSKRTVKTIETDAIASFPSNFCQDSS
jgi:hypothetical protein